MSTIPFTNFTKGEIAPELQARIDTQQYGAAARKIRNFIIQRYGGLAFRPGFRFVAEAEDVDANIRYIPFQFNIEQAYVLALENYNMRLLALGGVVVEENVQITAITQAAEPVVTAAFHGYSVGDEVFFDGITGMEELNGRTARVTNTPDANNFIIDISTVGFGAFVSSTGVSRSTPPPPPAPPPTPTITPTVVVPPVVAAGGGSGRDLGSRGDGNAFNRL